MARLALRGRASLRRGGCGLPGRVITTCRLPLEEIVKDRFPA